MISKLALVLLFFFGRLFADAATLNGVVLSNELGGAPMAKVKISAPGANPTETGAGGNFSLRLPNAQAGDVVQVTVNQPGYVVVNWVQLRTILPKNADAEVLIILLCKQSEREEWAGRFFRLKSNEAIDRTYNAKIKELEEKNQQTAEAMVKLRRERDQAQTAAERAAAELARLTPGDTADLYAEAMSLFLNGDVQGALTVLDDAKLRETMEAAQREKVEAEKAVDNAVQAFLLKGRLLTTQFQFGEAEHVYKSAIDAAPSSFEAHYAFGRFNQDLGHLGDARREYAQALQIDLNRGGATMRDIDVLSDFASLETAEKNFPQARHDYEIALAVFTIMAYGEESEIYLSKKARVLNNFGNLDKVEHRLTDAREHEQEALEIYTDLAKKDPDNYLSAEGVVLTNLGELDELQGRTGDASKRLKDALKIYRQPGRQDTQALLPNMAWTLLSMGNLVVHRLTKNIADTGKVGEDQGQLEECRQSLENALTIYRQLAQKNPDMFLLDVSETLRSLSILDLAEGRIATARDELHAIISIYQELSKGDPEKYAGSIGSIQSALSKLAQSGPDK